MLARCVAWGEKGSVGDVRSGLPVDEGSEDGKQGRPTLGWDRRGCSNVLNAAGPGGGGRKGLDFGWARGVRSKRARAKDFGKGRKGGHDWQKRKGAQPKQKTGLATLKLLAGALICARARLM